MSRFAIHPITSVETLLAPNRAERPNAFAPQADLRCPFCPGHEQDTPPSIAVWPETGPWKVRVFPNLYPLTDDHVQGMHEVIVDTPDHHRRPHSYSGDEIELLLQAFASRFEQSRQRDNTYALAFKNDGAAAGQSLEHPHSQFVALREAPLSIRSRAHDDACAICHDLEERSLTVTSEGGVRWFTPSSSRLPFELMVAPIAHDTDVVSFLRNHSTQAGRLLRDALGALQRAFGDAGFNLIVESSTTEARHAVITLIPRLTTIGGFELATNVLINVVDPIAAAEKYREAIREEVKR